MGRLSIDAGYMLDRLAALLEIPSPAGYTDMVVRECTAELQRLGAQVELTRRGAIRAFTPGKTSKGARAIIAHVDTLGAQVKALKDNGRLELVPIGHWSARFAEGARCTIFTEKGAWRGTILPLKASGHTFNEEVDTAPIGWPHAELRVDALTRSRADCERLGFAVGDIVAIDPQPEFLDNGYVVSRHLDDKAGVAAMFGALEAILREKAELPVDTFWLFSIAEEVGVGASSLLTRDVASLVAIDNGTAAPGQASDEFGVTIAMADQTGPFDYHLTRKLIRLCRDHDIRYQQDVFRYYRSDSASAIEAGEDVRTALITFGVDASHGYERTNVHALRSLAELVTAYLTSPVEITRDAESVSGIEGFTTQPMQEARAAHEPVVPRPHRA
ncbi:osmoprotectant NAGGN system M42 family peptidase [Methylobrevis albus]|uniref:Osmoprotectant NAGGN system M42 family peptidase n=1 Tax=Methylobrevis albus TaxID=2793297 RepID=A0A931HYR7_9HYPH|nr:osmoprotectant NAGGN system M42 family peptidase [Methylobrevis albus]MBH0236427.1 osmoprotectant NAGGN system M42 family peptidase [Methylobrevis albus]